MLDFTLRARVQMGSSAGEMRDFCVVFGYQDATHFYYLHLVQPSRGLANQILLVNGENQINIATSDIQATPWAEEGWHHIRVERNVRSGAIRFYFDNMEQPVMEAMDKTFVAGHVGIGSFGEIGNMDSVEIKGVRVPAMATKPESLIG